MVRLQKILADRGVASRRKSEELILEGRVKVNGVVITELGFKASTKDLIEVDGKVIENREKKYYLMYKPSGYLTSFSDALDRRTILDLYDDNLKKEKVYPIGRLDYKSSGALILTNDGDLANALIKNINKIEKVYRIRVEGILTQAMFDKLKKGLIIDNSLIKIANISDIKIEKKTNQSEFTITLLEGKNRLVRSIIEELGLTEKWIIRLSYAGISIDGLSKGQIRVLKPHEIKKLHSYSLL